MSSKSRKKQQSKKDTPSKVVPQTNMWDVAKTAIGRMANLADKNLIGCVIFIFGVCLCILAWRWPESDFPNLRQDLLTPMLYAPWAGLLVLFVAFKVLRNVYRQRIDELTAKLRKYEEGSVPNRISSRVPTLVDTGNS
jgi:hypothetical protein